MVGASRKALVTLLDMMNLVFEKDSWKDHSHLVRRKEWSRALLMDLLLLVLEMDLGWDMKKMVSSRELR